MSEIYINIFSSGVVSSRTFGNFHEYYFMLIHWRGNLLDGEKKRVKEERRNMEI